MAIDIKELNKDYSKQNEILKKLNEPGGLKDKISQFEEELAKASRDFKIKDAELQYAESKNDKTAIETLKKEKEALGNKVVKLRNQIQKSNDFINKQKSKVDAKLEELSKDPETKQKLDAILYKRYDRKRKAEFNKLQQLQTIKQIVDSHPNIQKLLKGIENYTQSIKGCNTIIKTLSSKTPLTPQEVDRLDKAKKELPQFELKRNQIRGNFVDYFSKKHPEIDKNLLENINSYGNLNRQIQGCEKSIGNYDKAMEQLSVSKQFENYQPPVPTQPLPPAPIDKPSWWNPIKRIKYAINERKIKKEAENELAELTSPQNEKEKKDFIDSLKLSKDEYNSEIVQKYLDNYQKNLHNVARQKEGNSEPEHDSK